MEQTQFDWLKQELIKSKRDKHIVLFSHFPFFINSPIEPESYSNIGIEQRSKYLALFREYKVEAVFAGHLHNNASAANGNTKMIVTSAVGKPLGSAPSGIRIIKVYRNRIESDYFSLDEVPETISFRKK